MTKLREIRRHLAERGCVLYEEHGRYSVIYAHTGKAITPEMTKGRLLRLFRKLGVV